MTLGPLPRKGETAETCITLIALIQLSPIPRLWTLILLRGLATVCLATAVGTLAAQADAPRPAADDPALRPADYQPFGDYYDWRKTIRYFRDYGLDVTSEHSSGGRLDPFVGLQAMAWIYEPPAPDIPLSLYCGSPRPNR